MGVRRKNYFHLFHNRTEVGGTRRRDVIQICPTPTKFQKIFCPVTILSHYCKIRKELCHGDDTDFLFPKLSLAFEQGTNKNVLCVVTPHECIPTVTYDKKFKAHVDSEEFKVVG